MTNFLHPFTIPLFQAFVTSGKRYFVRNQYLERAKTVDKKQHSFIITHYDDISKASAHYNSIQDPYKYFYDLNELNDKERLMTAAGQPEGYHIYSSLFVSEWRSKITPATKQKINTYMYNHTTWKPKSGEHVNLNFYFQFGQLYFTLSYHGNKITGKFEEIEH